MTAPGHSAAGLRAKQTAVHDMKWQVKKRIEGDVEYNAKVFVVHGRVMKKEERIVELIRSLRKDSFTGFIRISYDLGGIQRVEKNEEILKKGKL